jgi:hypothetical protein
VTSVQPLREVDLPQFYVVLSWFGGYKEGEGPCKSGASL